MSETKSHKVTSVRSRVVRIEVAGIVIIVTRSKTKAKRTIVRFISDGPLDAIVTGVDK